MISKIKEKSKYFKRDNKLYFNHSKSFLYVLYTIVTGKFTGFFTVLFKFTNSCKIGYFVISIFIFSGDNYSWFLKREYIKTRLYITPTFSFANIIPFNIYNEDTLPFKIFPLSLDNINAIYTNNIEPMMGYDNNKSIIKTIYIDKLTNTPTPMTGGNFKEKYIKYKNKYLLLKSQYN